MEGCNKLGLLYDRGRGVPEDDVAAATLYEAACDGGYTRACGNLGNSYLRDSRASPAIFFSKRACDANEWNGCNNLAHMYKEGHGLPQDLSLATSLFEKSARIMQKCCEDGEMLACHFLAVSYENGEGVPQDMAKS